MTLGNIADADLLIRRIQDIGAVTAGIHPTVHNSLRGSISLGDVFPGCAVGETEGGYHLKRRAVCRAVVGEIAVFQHILRFIACDP